MINPDTTYYYSSISHYYHPPYGDAASLLKMDFNGNVVDVYDLAPLNSYGKMVEAKFITDSTLAAGAVWGTSGPPNFVIIDTLGNILKQSNLLDNDQMAYVQVTFDKKLLFFTNIHDENYKFDAYLFKFNQNLESDTVYTYYFTYDSLCDGEIVSDTIVQDDCGIIVGDVEMHQKTEENRLVIYPNPAGAKFKVQSRAFETGNCMLEIVDLLGRKAEELYVPKGEEEVEINTRGWEKGLYVVKVTNSKGKSVAGKVLVK